MKTKEYAELINNGGLDARFEVLYGKENPEKARARYVKAIKSFEDIYGKENDICLFSVPGRSEISGNHTDHNRGKVIAASVNLDIIAVAAKTDDNTIRLKSRGFDEDTVKLNEALEPCEAKKFRAESLIRGVCRGFSDKALKTGGFKAYTDSNVFKGSGLSSSAAFEDMVGTILNHFYNDGKIDYITIARISQFAENVFFGKPSGLMDQVACASGGFVGIDFNDNNAPKVRRVDFDLKKNGYELIIVNTGGNHANLNDDYASVPAEMKAVAAFFGKTHLRDVDRSEFEANMKKLREAMKKKGCGDRAVLRAYHFLEENDRVTRQLEALEKGDMDAFLNDVKNSGRSSFCWLQNIYTCKAPDDQGLSMALMMCEKLLSDKKAAWRVHGGGFAGTVQAFVPEDYSDEFIKKIDDVFGSGSAVKLFVRADGAVAL
ncbi:MAG: galactokinase [Ruminococcaceae bacterium]|nr:galactokinase [Oscillospiraceae bacterium]